MRRWPAPDPKQMGSRELYAYVADLLEDCIRGRGPDACWPNNEEATALDALRALAQAPIHIVADQSDWKTGEPPKEGWYWCHRPMWLNQCEVCRWSGSKWYVGSSTSGEFPRPDDWRWIGPLTAPEPPNLA